MPRINTRKPILFDNETLDELKRLQDVERKRSPLGAAPSINTIARHYMRKALGIESVKTQSGSKGGHA
ncbi:MULTISPECIES: hypothetical protein [unclassified Serratia (in: enterobacteria)]|uniref:hypothetical protein n=1 Tax=unclassified Serratia (in: enterobacteria) TaxID=2647522 RepID=UPI0030766DC7